MSNLIEYSAPPLMTLLSAQTRKALSDASVRVKYNHGQIIHSRGDDKPGISIVRAGAVRIGAIGTDGSFITVSLMGIGQSFGEHTLFADLPRINDVSAVGNTEIDQIAGPAFMRLFSEIPELGPALLKISLSRTYYLLERLDDMRRLALHVRLAKLLSSFGPDSAPAQTSLDIPCRQSELAFMLGVSRVALGKAVKRLEKAGLICQGYRQIKLLDLYALQSWIAKESKVAPLKHGITKA